MSRQKPSTARSAGPARSEGAVTSPQATTPPAMSGAPPILPSIANSVNNGLVLPPDATSALPLTSESVSLLQMKLQEVCDRAHRSAQDLEITRIDAKKRVAELTARISFLQSELTRKDQANKTLAQQLQEITKKHQDEIEVNKQFMEQTLKRAHELFLQKESILLQKHEEALKELSELRVFQQVKQDLVAQLTDTQEALRTTEQRHKAQLEMLEKKFIAAREQLQAEAAALLQQSKDVYRLEASKELDAEGRLIRTQNLKLSKQVKLQEQRIQQSTQANNLLTKELSDIKLEHELLQERCNTLLQRQAGVQRQKQQLEEKLRDTERGSALLTSAIENERAAGIEYRGKEVASLMNEISSLKAMLLRKDHELRQVRKHARVLVDARREVETFLSEALDNAKKEVRLRAEIAYREAVQQHQRRLASLARGAGDVTDISGGLLPPLPPPKHVSLKDLSPEDRLEIIRIVYARLRGVPLASRAVLPKYRETGDEDVEAEDDREFPMDGNNGSGNFGYNVDPDMPLAVTHVPTKSEEPQKKKKAGKSKNAGFDNPEEAFFLTAAHVDDGDEENDEDYYQGYNSTDDSGDWQGNTQKQNNGSGGGSGNPRSHEDDPPFQRI